MSLAFVDSSAFLSLEAPDERAHDKVRQAFERLAREGTRLITTNFVFDEAYTLIMVRLGRDRAFTWGERFLASKLLQRIRISEEHEAQAWDIIATFSDKEFSFTDATSFAVCEDLNIGEALSLDRHFRQYGRLEVVP